MTPKTWVEDLELLGGHVHDEATYCLHRDGEFCRVCCPHSDDPRIAEPELEDSDWRVEVDGSLRALVWTLGATVLALVIVLLSALTLAGVIPS